MATKHPMPTNLGPKSRRLWRDVAAKYDLRPDECRLLEDSCREVDLIERLEAALVDAPLMERGSQGQMVASPLVSELRQHRSVLAGLFRALKLPDESGRRGESAEEISAKARAAARSRWGG